jgi:two-component system LytT family response regulator
METSTEIKTVIVEDDPISVKLLQEILKKYSFINIVGIATSYDEAEVMLKNTKSLDLLITDIDLKGTNALDLIQFIRPETNILFTTSFAEFAIKAFEFNTLDYILKPISPERVKKALERLRVFTTKVAPVPVEVEEVVVHAEPSSTNKLSYSNMILVNVNNEMKFIKIRDINYIQAKGNYTNIGLITGFEFTTYGLIKVWEEKLPEADFFRIHRSTIINLNNVVKIEKGTYDTGLMFLKSLDTPLEISRSYFSQLKNRYKFTSNSI